MFAETLFASVELALIGPLSTVEFAIIGGLAVLAPLVTVWVVLSKKITHLQAEAAAALKVEQSRSADHAAEAKKTAMEAAARLTDLEQRFATHREVADRRANDASQQISRLESDLAAARELAAQLTPTQARIKDLETALSSEQGRVKAQDQAMEATNARYADLEKRLAEAQDLLLKHKAEMQEYEVELKRVRAEHAASAAAGGPEVELVKARELNQQAESKIVQLQRSLKAAEARVEIVQKEFMNAVGLATAPTPGSSTPAAASDKKMRELEEKLTQTEAEFRKRAREDGYKIAELEYRLSEALEAVVKAISKPALSPEAEPVTSPSVVIETPQMESLSKETSEDEAVADVAEPMTADALKVESVAAIPLFVDEFQMEDSIAEQPLVEPKDEPPVVKESEPETEATKPAELEVPSHSSAPVDNAEPAE